MKQQRRMPKFKIGDLVEVDPYVWDLSIILEVDVAGPNDWSYFIYDAITQKYCWQLESTIRSYV